MELFDELIVKTYDLLPEKGESITTLPDSEKFVGNKNELVLSREQAYELGGPGLSCAVYSLFTENPDLVNKDEIVIYGKDINKIKEDCSFATIAIIQTDDIDKNGEQGAYDILAKMQLRRYDVHPEGYMIRTSVLSNREQVRVSKTAIKNKLSFANVGAMYINAYHKNPHVKAVKMIFITDPKANYNELDKVGMLSVNMFRTLNHAVNDLKMDCSHCEWKIVCDEVEGMKEMHQKMIDEKKSQLN